MATVSHDFNPSDIFQGPADIYLGVKAPPSAVPPVQYTNTLQLDANGQPPIGSTGQIATAAINDGSTGYAVGDDLIVVQSGGENGILRVTTIDGDGTVTGFVIVKEGSGYAAATGLSTIGGTGTGATFDIETINSGYHLGLTEGPAQSSITPKFNLIKADQFAAEIDAAFVSLECEIDFILKEFQLRQIERLFGGIFTSTYFDLAVGGANPAADFLQIGNTASSQARTNTLLLVAPRRDSPGKFMYVLAYKAFIKSAIQMPVQRGKETTVKLKFGCLADLSRVAKDMVLQVVKST